MVNLKESDDQPVVRNWRYSHRPRVVQQEPKTLLELELLVQKQILLMKKYGETNSSHESKVMDLLRCQYNLVSIFIFHLLRISNWYIS